MNNPRTILIFCDGGTTDTGEPRHDPIDLAALVANPYYEPERWEVDDRAERQHLVHPADADAAPGMLYASGHVTERVKIRCKLCGRDKTVGDRLGVGYTTMVEKRAADALGAGYRTRPERGADRLTASAEDAQTIPPPVPAKAMRPDIAQAISYEPRPSARLDLPHGLLSQWADNFSDALGVSRLPLAALGRIGP